MPASTRASLRSTGTLPDSVSTIREMFVVPTAPYSRAMPYSRKADEKPPSTKYLMPLSALPALRR